jgi:hypothetical protein
VVDSHDEMSAGKRLTNRGRPGGPAAAGLLLGLGGGGLGCAAGGWFMVWLGRGWDTPLDSAADLYKYGRPGNAEVLSVEGAQLDAAGTRTAKLSVRVSPVNESDYKTTRTVAIPGGRIPAVGETVTSSSTPTAARTSSCSNSPSRSRTTSPKLPTPTSAA